MRKKTLYLMSRLIVCLFAVLSSTTAFAGAGWVGAAIVKVNDADYRCDGHESTTGLPEFSAGLGSISELKLGGEIQLWDSGGYDWKGGTAYMYYKFDDDEDYIKIDLTYYKFENNNNFFKNDGVNISIVGLSLGTHTLYVKFVDFDGYQPTGEYTANFTKAIGISDAEVTGINATYAWTGTAIHPEPVVTVGGTTLTSSDYDVTYSEGCTNVGDYTVTITGKDNYTGTKIVNFSIVVPTGYYLVGDMNNWNLESTYQLTASTETSGEYYINNVELSSGQGFKVARTDDGKSKNAHFPDGSNNNYSPGAGKFFIYFRSDGQGGDGWHYGNIYATKTASVDVNLAPTGYGTYYNSVCDVTLPSGVVAYVMNDGTPSYEKIADGDGDGTTTKKTVPAGVAVLLYDSSKPAKVTLTLNTETSDTRTFDSNKLHGSDVETTTTGGATYYKLTYSDDNSKFGWFWSEDNGAAFTSPAHKAWLALPATGARAFFGLPGDDNTGIATIKDNQQNADNMWYDLNGRRINAPMTKGIYVNEGRKIVIK